MWFHRPKSHKLEVRTYCMYCICSLSIRHKMLRTLKTTMKKRESETEHGLDKT